MSQIKVIYGKNYQNKPNEDFFCRQQVYLFVNKQKNMHKRGQFGRILVQRQHPQIQKKYYFIGSTFDFSQKQSMLERFPLAYLITSMSYTIYVSLDRQCQRSRSQGTRTTSKSLKCLCTYGIWLDQYLFYYGIHKVNSFS